MTGAIDFASYQSATQALDSRGGDCTEFAVLLAAAARARGIPTRVVAGISYASRFLDRKHDVPDAVRAGRPLLRRAPRRRGDRRRQHRRQPAVHHHAIDGLFTQAAMEGISVFVSSGDSGAADCALHTESPPAGQTASINALCSSGSVTCVGGTQFADTADPDAYWSRTSSSGTGYRSALGYIPEGACR